jgi:hypothetical protein
MPRAGFETVIPATKRPQTYDLQLDCAATEIGYNIILEVLQNSHIEPVIF